MCFFQQNPPLAFGGTLLWKWLEKSHFSLSVLKIDMTDHCLTKVLKVKTGQKAVSIHRIPKRNQNSRQ